MHNEPFISLLLPTRQRIKLIERLFDSIKETASEPARLEIVLYIDEDDRETQGINCKGISLNKLIGQRETMGRMTNICYERSSGRFVMLMNDDVIFRTKNWDKRILAEFSRFEDNIAMVYGNDLYQMGGVATFPVLSRPVCEIMGGVCPPEYKYSHIDTHLYDIFRKLSSMGHKRYIYMPGVIFEHMHYEVGKSEIDEIYRRNNPREDEIAYISWDDEREWLANRLLQRIKRG